MGDSSNSKLVLELADRYAQEVINDTGSQEVQLERAKQAIVDYQGKYKNEIELSASLDNEYKSILQRVNSVSETNYRKQADLNLLEYRVQELVKKQNYESQSLEDLLSSLKSALTAQRELLDAADECQSKLTSAYQDDAEAIWEREVLN